MANFKPSTDRGAPHSVLKTRLLPRASDGTVLAARYDAAGNLIEARVTGADGKHHVLTIQGAWPNQTALFSDNDDIYFSAKTTLERIPVAWPRIGLRSTHIFSYHLSSPLLSMLYELIPAPLTQLAPPDNRLRLFAAVKSMASDKPNQSWQPVAALHGTYDYETRSFPSLSNIDAAALAGALVGTGNLFTAAETLKPVTWDASPDGNFKHEWSRAAYFAPILGVPDSGGAPIVFDGKGSDKSILGDMLGWCVGGGVAGGLGGPEGAALGCLGGALGVALSAFFNSITDNFSPYDDHLFEGPGDGTTTLGQQGNETPGMYDHLREKLEKDPPP